MWPSRSTPLDEYVLSNGFLSMSAGATLFSAPGLLPDAVETNRQLVLPSARTISRLALYTSGPATSGTFTATLRQNGADTIMTATVASGSSAQLTLNTASQVSFSAGDRLSIKFVLTSTSDYFFVRPWGYGFSVSV